MFNIVILTGRLTSDVELKTTPNGVSVCSFSIAVERRYRQGEERQADFINIVAWRSSAEFICKYFKKGSMIGIEGSIQTRKYQDRDGNNRTAARCSYIEQKRETTFKGIGANLFMQYVRALKEVKPKYFLYENNASMSTEIKNEITKHLGVEPILIDSADFSAQTRKRLYWTNIPFALNFDSSSVLFCDIEYKANHKINSFEKYLKTVKDNGVVISWDTSGKGNYSQQNRARRVANKMNTLPSSGNDKDNIYLGGYLYRKIHPIEAERLQTLPDNYTACIPSAIKRTELCGNGWTVDVIAHIFTYLPIESGVFKEE